MRKYWQFFKINFEFFLEYRGDIAISFILKLGIFFAFVFIWKAIDREGKSIDGYGLSGIILYYLLAQILDGLITSQSARDFRRDILYGELSAKILKPMNIHFYMLTRHFARLISETLLNLFLAIPIIFIFPYLLSTMHINLIAVFQFIFVSFCASIWGFTLYSFVGYIAFWTKEAHAFQIFIKNSTRFVNGGLIPLDLLPLLFQKVIMWLPCPYSLYFPIKILMGNIKFSSFLHSIIILLIWIIIFTIINIFIWRKGLKEYEAVGI
jgi:ABC-2 type transport system permease protein